LRKLNFSKDRVAEAMDIRERWYAGEKTERTPFVFTVTPEKSCSYVSANPYNFIEMCGDADKAVEGQLIGMQHQFDTFPDCDYLPVMVLHYFGQGILASMYGAKQLIVEKDPPFTEGRLFNDIYETERMDNDFDIEKTEWGRMLKEHVERFVDATDGQVPVGPPDYQSPYGTATKLMPNEELMMAMYDEPELTRKFLGKVTDGIIKLSDTMEKWAGKGNYAHNQSNPIPGKCGIIIWDDYISVITPELHKEFCAPCNRKLYERYGSGHLHTCGPYFPGYIDACFECLPRSMDVSIMRGMGKTKKDMLEFLSLTEKKGLRLFGALTANDESVFNEPWEQPDNGMIERFARGGWMPAAGGSEEEGAAFKKTVEDIDSRR